MMTMTPEMSSLFGSLRRAATPLFPIIITSFYLLAFITLNLPTAAAATSPAAPAPYSSQQQALDPGSLPSGNTVPAFPVIQQAGGGTNNQTGTAPTTTTNPSSTCHLDLSDELFGGVSEACGRTLDRSRCCPVLAAWLFAAHARSALDVRTRAPLDGGTPLVEGDDDDSISPMMPDDSQKCVDALQASLTARSIRLARPNASCDTVLCFCGIRLHQLSTLKCPAAFNFTTINSSSSAVAPQAATPARNATPTAALKGLERDCRNSSYAGCSRCLVSLQKLKGGVSGSGDRANRMFGRDCQLMGLTWLLARNKSAYIPTVSAVLRALLYSAHPTEDLNQQQHQQQPRCSPDQENMPLAVDSLQIQKHDISAAAPTYLGPMTAPTTSFLALGALLLAVGGVLMPPFPDRP